jgi:heptosyltransferase I
VYWRVLAERVTQAGYAIYLNSGNAEEYARAQRIADGFVNVHAMPRKKIAELAQLLRSASAAVALDTGLAHLAAALAVPTVSLYSSTDPQKTGTFGVSQYHLRAEFECAPCLQKTCTYTKESTVQPACFASLDPEKVWKKMRDLLANVKNIA